MPQRLKAHIAIHNKQLNHCCEECGKAFDSEKRLLKHKRGHSKLAEPICCEICGKEFYSRHGLGSHRTMVHHKTNIRCDKCGKGFSSGRGLHIHKVQQHGEVGLMCEVCGDVYTSEQGLRLHKDTHKDELVQLPCDICNITFATLVEFQEHVKSVVGLWLSLTCLTTGQFILLSF